MLTRSKVIKTNGDYKPENPLIARMRGLYFTMNFLGLWPRRSSQNWYNLIWCVQLMGFIFQLFGPTAGMIRQRHDKEKLIENLALVVPIACICVKWITFTLNRNTIKTILCFMEEDWKNVESNVSINATVPSSKRIMATYSKFAKIYFNIYLITVSLAVTNFVRSSFAAIYSDGNSTDFDKIFPMPNSWYPLNYNRSFNVQFLAVTQSITSATVSIANGSMDSTFIAATLHLCGQLEILQHSIQDITYDSSKPNCCKTRIRLTVKRHQILLKVAKNLQESFDLFILEHLITCVLSTCFLQYSLIMEMEKNEASVTVLLHTGFLCGAILESFFSFCLVGDWLSNQSTAIEMAVYNSQWYNCTRPINLSFLMIMVRASKPVQISGGKMVPISLESFTVLMKASVSYLSVLRATKVGEH